MTFSWEKTELFVEKSEDKSIRTKCYVMTLNTIPQTMEIANALCVHYINCIHVPFDDVQYSRGVIKTE